MTRYILNNSYLGHYQSEVSHLHLHFRESLGSALLVKNKISLSHLVDSPFIAVVFLLEYIVSMPTSMQDRKVRHTQFSFHLRAECMKPIGVISFLKVEVYI